MAFKGSLIKMATVIRKRLSEETVSSRSVRNFFVPAFVELLKVYGPEKTVRLTFKWGFQMGCDFMMELKKDAEKINMQNPHERAAMGEVAWYMFMGTKPEVTVTFEEIAGEKILVLRLRDRDNPLTRGVTVAEKVPLCYYAAGAYEGASQTVYTLQNKDIFVLTREIRCRAAGDPYCELLLFDIPEKSLEKVCEEIAKRYPDFFRYVDLKYSLQLRETAGI